jgi:NAD(P)-dependent dehydrogenase (short-subunit alcohol dehydrogenase family)
MGEGHFAGVIEWLLLAVNAIAGGPFVLGAALAHGVDRKVPQNATVRLRGRAMSITPFTPGRFAGKTAIVTGAGSGIGRATAVRLAQEGARVIAADISQPRLKELVDDFPDLEFVTVPGDIVSQEDVEAIIAASNGRVDALANVAGIMDAFLPPAEVDDATWQRVFDVNLNAVMRLTRAALPLMIDAGEGSIVNVSSEASFRASASGAAYTASKHAVNGYTKSVAVFYKGKGIRCNAVAPGAVLTNIEAPFRSEHAAAVLGPIMQTTVPAPANSEDLAATITYLLSDDARNMNGAIVACDGGWSAI